MSTYIRYEITITSLSLASADTRTDIRVSLLEHDGCGLSPEGPLEEEDEPMDRVDGIPVWTLWGEESDWSRSHEERHRAVVEAVRVVCPDAKVQTSWLNLEHMPWDETFDSDDQVPDE
jgi:hypothetical protein